MGYSDWKAGYPGYAGDEGTQINPIDRHIPLDRRDTVYRDAKATVDFNRDVVVEIPLNEGTSAFPPVNADTLQVPEKSWLDTVREAIRSGEVKS